MRRVYGRLWRNITPGQRVERVVILLFLLGAGGLVAFVALGEREEGGTAEAPRRSCAAQATAPDGTCTIAVSVTQVRESEPLVTDTMSVRVLESDVDDDGALLRLRIRNPRGELRTLRAGQLRLRVGDAPPAEATVTPAIVDLPAGEGETVEARFPLADEIDAEAAAQLEVVPWGEETRAVPRRVGVIAVRLLG